jgi:D-sedoheptulose 7-phosphate isomerase
MAGTTCKNAQAYLDEMGKLLKSLDAAPMDAFADCVYQAWRDGRRVFVFGNGGSASTASHYVADFVKTAAVEGQKRLAAFCLNDNIGLLTALGNDISYDETFSYPLASYAHPGDVAVALSCSGNSPNVLHAARWAREHGMTVVALTGFAGGKLKELADIHINIPSSNYGLIEDLHLSVNHVVAQSLQSRIMDGVNETCVR